jgi:hypothetical protein
VRGAEFEMFILKEEKPNGKDDYCNIPGTTDKEDSSFT